MFAFLAVLLAFFGFYLDVRGVRDPFVFFIIGAVSGACLILSGVKPSCS